MSLFPKTMECSFNINVDENRPVLLLHLHVQPQAEMRHFFSVTEHSKIIVTTWQNKTY